MQFIESSITTEAKITQLMRRLELLEDREPDPVNHVTQPKCLVRVAPIVMPWPTYSRSIQYTRFNRCSLTVWMQPTPDPITILIPRHTTRDGGIISIFLRVSLILSSQDNSFHINMLLKLMNPQFPSNSSIQFSADSPTQFSTRLPTSVTKSFR